MGSRERKRAERRKRKRRSAERGATVTGEQEVPQQAETDGAREEEKESFQERLARRSEERNAQARRGLEPLAEGERPSAVTVGAVISTLIAAIFTVSAIVAAVTSVEVSGEEPSPLPLAVFALVLWMMAWGMWKTRYWAVLGFQMVLVLLILSTAVGLGAQELSVLHAIGSLLLIGGLGTLFYFMIRAMARIQMPEPPG